MEQNDIDFKIVGKNLRRIMAEKNYTFPQMSRITNVPLNSLRGYMYCTSYPTSKQIQKMAKGLRIEVAELFRE